MGILDAIFGTSNAASKAAKVQNKAIDKGIGELRSQFAPIQESFQPFLDAGTTALGDLEQAATPGGLNERLEQIFGGDTFGALRDERTRAVEGQLASGGLTRSGTAVEQIADIPTQLGLFLEQLLQGRSAGLAGAGQSAAGSLGTFGSNLGGNIASLFGQQGQNTGSGIIGDQQESAGALSNIFSGVGSVLGLPTAAGGSVGASILTALPFSDPRLKTNVVQIGNMGDLGVYQWDWIPEMAGTIVEKAPGLGFMANEVEEFYPDYVGEFAGWKIIDYAALLDRLETDLRVH